MDMTLTLGFLIIAGFALVMGARWLSKRQKQGQAESDEEEIRLSTEQLKAEMERSADAVISRLGSHIKHLEKLVQEADDRNRRLESQLSQAQQTESDLMQQARQLEAEIQEARRISQELAAHCQAAALQAAGTSVALAPASVMTSLQPPVERVDAQDFAAVLKQSMERDGQMQGEVPPAPPASIQQAAGLAEAMESHPAADDTAGKKQTDIPPNELPPVEISPNAAKARALLLSGYSIEETARETGIGKGAIELLREMNRRELETP